MVIIPEQLKKCRFIKANENKQPIEEKWNSIGGNNYSYKEFNGNSSKNNIYGVLCGYNNLIVIDIDDRETQCKIMMYAELNDTFIVRTAGKKLFHIYLEVTNVPEIYQDKERGNQPLGLRIDNEYNKRIIDVQGAGTQVIGPNSLLGDNRCYDVVKPLPIKQLDYMFLIEILKSVDEKGLIIQNNKKKKTFNEKHGDEILDFDEVCAEIKRNIKPVNLLIEHFEDDNIKYENPTKCPLHTSDGGKCLHHTNNVWHCFHCGSSGNVFHLFMKIHNCQFREAKRKLATRLGLEDDLRNKVLNLMFDKDEKKNGGEAKAIDLISSEIIKLFHVHTIRKDDNPEIWVYKEGIYISEGRTFINEFVQELLQTYYNLKTTKNIIDNIISKTYTSPTDFFTNEDLSLVAVKNGILNIFTRKLLPFSPKYKFFTKLNTIYDPLIKADKSIQFIKDITKDDTDVKVIQELMGFILYRDYKFEHAFLFQGEGRNGKSKLLELIGSMIGHENKSNLSLHSLAGESFMTSYLMGKMINLSTDLSNKELDDVSTFKAITGHDTLTCDRKFKNPIQFVNYAKIIIACNTIPEINDTSFGFFNRLILLEFPFEFVDNPEIYKTSNQRKRDISIIEKITTEKELIGLLNWSLDGFERLMLNGKFTYNKSTEDTKMFIIRKSSTFYSFLLDVFDVDEDTNSYVTIPSIHNAYRRYCLKYKVKNIERDPRKKNGHIEKFGGYRSTKYIDGVVTKVWRGLKFKNNDFKEVDLDE